MNKHDIDKDVIRTRLEDMINILEYDSMRSSGKAKMNSQHLHSMHWLLQNVYKAPAKKAAAKKEG